MKIAISLKFLSLVILLTNCVSQSQLQTAVDNSKRLEILIEKERKENDQLNANKSIFEAQIQALNTQVQKLQAEKISISEAYNTSLIKSKDEKTKLETKIKALEGTLAQQAENNRLTVGALGDKLNDLAEGKQALINEKYNARKKTAKRKRRRR